MNCDQAIYSVILYKLYTVILWLSVVLSRPEWFPLFLFNYSYPPVKLWIK